MRRYYQAYDDRYRQIHAMGRRWTADARTPAVLDTIGRCCSRESSRILEIGCGEGRDALAVLEAGYNLTATDISPEAIAFCHMTMPQYADHFEILDCICGIHDIVYDFIYSVAVIHMLVDDDDRRAFYRFIHDHLSQEGSAMICSMGDGKHELRTDPAEAFELRERNHPSGKVTVAATSCRMVCWETFLKELAEGGLAVVERGITSAVPDFDSLMYVVARRSD